MRAGEKIPLHGYGELPFPWKEETDHLEDEDMKIEGTFNTSPSTLTVHGDTFTVATTGTATMTGATVTTSGTIERRKVTLTQAQDKALRSARISHMDELVVRLHSGNPKRWTADQRALHDMSLDTLIRAIYVGYDTAKDHPLKTVYDNYADAESGDPFYKGYYQGVRQGIRESLRKLDVKVEGINV